MRRQSRNLDRLSLGHGCESPNGIAVRNGRNPVRLALFFDSTAGLYALAGVTAWSRVYHDNHWFSDTFLGAALGTSVGLAVSCEKGEGSPVGLLIEPSLSGVRLELDF